MPFDIDLWQRICALQLDEPGARLSFSARLARDMCWTRHYTERAIGEYRRFLYLASTCGHVVTPSEDVDAVWHMHMTYTRSYWHDLCRDTLQRELHHGPTRGGAAETRHFREVYETTRRSYQHAFGEAAPEDIWPVADIRFARKQFRSIDTSQYWTIPKRPFRALRFAFGAKALVTCVLGATTGAALAANGEGLFGFSTQAWIAIIAAVLVLSVVLMRRAKRGRNSYDNSSDWHDHTHHDSSSFSSRDDNVRPHQQSDTAPSSTGTGTLSPATSGNPSVAGTAAIAGTAAVAAAAGVAIAANAANATPASGKDAVAPVANAPGDGVDSGSSTSSGGWFSSFFGGDSSSDSSSNSSSDSSGGDSGCGSGCGGGD